MKLLLAILSSCSKRKETFFDKVTNDFDRYRFFVSIQLNKSDNKNVFIIDNDDLYNFTQSVQNLNKEQYQHLGRHLVDTETWRRQLVKILSPEQRKLSPWSIWNDPLLIENLVNDWSLEKWG